MTPLFLLRNVLLLVSSDNSKNKCFTLLVRTLRRLVSLKYGPLAHHIGIMLDNADRGLRHAESESLMVGLRNPPF